MATDDSTQLNGNYGAGLNSRNSYDGQISKANSLQVNGNMGSLGSHNHKNEVARGKSIQINGNVGANETPDEIRRNAGRPGV
jgi:hypothetical protein